MGLINAVSCKPPIDAGGQRPRTIQRLKFIRKHLDKPDAEIAQMLGVRTQAVQLLRQRYKITKVHSFIQRRQRILNGLRRLKPGLSAKAAVAQLGISIYQAKYYGEQVGYQFLGASAARHFHWRQRLKSLPPRLTISAVARELGVSYGHAALLCCRNKYKVTLRTGWKPTRVPIRR